MKTRYFNWPVYREQQDYERAISLVTNTLSEQKELVGLYQVGSVSDPGISDIDLVAVFEDGYATMHDPLAVLDNKLKYLFPHGVFAISNSHFQKYRRFLFYFNFNKLYGNLDEINTSLSVRPEDNNILKNQIAIEFLLFNFMKKEIEAAYKMVDVRSSLLSAKAILIDLDFLGIKNDDLSFLIRQVIAWRKTWFKSTPSIAAFDEWNTKFVHALRTFMNECLKVRSFYLPNANDSIRYARHIQIKKDIFALPERTGIGFLLSILPVSKRYFRLWNRFNRFNFRIPWIGEGIPETLNERFASIKKLNEYQKRYFPLYTPLTGNIKNILN